MANGAGQYGALGPRVDEEHHIAGHHHGVERPAQVEMGVGQVGTLPWEPWCLLSRPVEHGRILIDAGHVESAAGQLDGHPTGATSRIEHRPHPEGGHKPGLAVDVMAGGRQCIEAPVIGVAPRTVTLEPRVVGLVVHEREAYVSARTWRSAGPEPKRETRNERPGVRTNTLGGLGLND